MAQQVKYYKEKGSKGEKSYILLLCVRYKVDIE
jgi:hypothetical protein